MVDDDETIVDEDEEDALVVDDEDTIVDEDEDNAVVEDEVGLASIEEAVYDVGVTAGVLELELELQLPYEDRHPVPQ